MNRRLVLWLVRIDAGHPRAVAQYNHLQSAVGGVAGAASGLALGLIVLRPILHVIGFEGVWR